MMSKVIMAGEIRNVDGLCTVLISDIAPFADVQVSNISPLFLHLPYLMHGHQT